MLRVRRLDLQGFYLREAWQCAKQRNMLFMATTDKSEMAILPMFTTLLNSQERNIFYENTIRNWHLLSLDAIPLSFTEVDPSDPMGMAHFAVKHGWHVFPVPKTSPKGIPILRHMYLEAQKKSNTTFYCYIKVMFCSTEIE